MKVLLSSTLILSLFALPACNFNLAKVGKEGSEAVQNLGNEFNEIKTDIQNTVQEIEEAKEAIDMASDEVGEAINAVKKLNN